MTQKKHYFFSDVHLGFGSRDEERNRESKVVRFLESIRGDAGKIFIVGDLFDCWIEYRRVVPKGYYRLLSKLNEIAESGTEINFFSGNHDFWFNKYLSEDVGLKMRHDSMETEIEGKKFFITHGDGLSKGDTGYKIIKRILRNKVNQFLYSLIHPDIGIWLAQGSSKRSRLQNPDSYGTEGMKEFAASKLKDGFDYVVMGHFHKPMVTPFETGRNSTGYFITLGDWLEHDSYGIFSGGSFELKAWKE